MAYTPPTVWIDTGGAYHRKEGCSSLVERGAAEQMPLPVARQTYGPCAGCACDPGDDHAEMWIGAGGGEGSERRGPAGLSDYLMGHASRGRQ